MARSLEIEIGFGEGRLSQMISDEYFTIREAAEFLRLSEQTLRNKMSRKVFKQGIHFFKREGEITARFKRAALIEWLEGAPGARENEKPANVIEMARGYRLKMEG